MLLRKNRYCEKEAPYRLESEIQFAEQVEIAGVEVDGEIYPSHIVLDYEDAYPLTEKDLEKIRPVLSKLFELTKVSSQDGYVLLEYSRK